MEKDQLDSLATVAVGSEKMPPPHSHYAPSEVYSASESPPAYSRPQVKSTAVQIARIIATTLIAISVIIGSFILASAWLQARASCTPESIAAMQPQMNLQQSQNEFIKHLQPEALVQSREAAKENVQSVSESSSPSEKTEAPTETKETKAGGAENGNTKADNDNGDQNDSEEDYDDSEFPPVHLKLPLQLDLDDLAGNLLQQARSAISFVVERQRSGETTDGNNNDNNNATERQCIMKLNGDRVTIICESGDLRQEQQDQEVLTPIIVPLGTVQIPLNQENGYNSYQVQNQYQVPESQRVPINVEERRMNIPFPINNIPPELRNIPLAMIPNSRIAPHPHVMRPQMNDMREMPVEVRHLHVEPVHGMRVPSEQDMFARGQQQQQHENNPIIFENSNTMGGMNVQAQNLQGMMPPPPPPQMPQSQEPRRQTVEPRINPIMSNINMQIEDRRAPESQETPEGVGLPFRGFPMDFTRFIQQVPHEINNILQHITGERSMQNPIPEGARRVHVQEFKPFPKGIPPRVDAIAMPVEMKNYLERGNEDDSSRQGSQESEEQQPNTKLFPATDEQSEEAEKKFPVPPNVMSIIHQVIEGEFPIPRFGMPLRSVESMDVPVEAQASVKSDEDVHQPEERQNVHDEAPKARMMVLPEESNRPHFVQPRSIRSVPVPEASAHPREKRTRLL